MGVARARAFATRMRALVLSGNARREYFGTLRDQLLFERRYGRMLRAISAPPDGSHALIVSLSDSAHQVKFEGVFAKALQLRGLVPVVLTAPWARSAHRYFRSFGIDEFIYCEQFEQAADDQNIDALVEAALQEPTVQSLKSLQFRGADVGIHALSSVSRGFQQGRISLADPLVRQALRRTLRESMIAVLEAEALLDHVRPAVVLFLEKGYAPFGSIYDVALLRGLNVIQYVAAGIHWRDALLLKRYDLATRRLHPASLSDDSWREVAEMRWTSEHEQALEDEFALRYGAGEKHPDAGLQEGKRVKSPAEVRVQLGLDPSKKVAIVFSHVLWDANLFYGDDLFEDMETWLVETVRAACANPNLEWIIKLHPANLYKADRKTELNDRVAIREAVGNLPGHVTLLDPATDINTYSLFAVADYGITIRGTIGMELPCFRIPVLTAGTGRYSGRGFTIDSPTASIYLERLARLHEYPELTEAEVLLAKRHAYGIFRLRPFRFTSLENRYGDVTRLGERRGQNLTLSVNSSDELRAADDLARFAAWAADSTALDYLDRRPVSS